MCSDIIIGRWPLTHLVELPRPIAGAKPRYLNMVVIATAMGGRCCFALGHNDDRLAWTRLGSSIVPHTGTMAIMRAVRIYKLLIMGHTPNAHTLVFVATATLANPFSDTRARDMIQTRAVNTRNPDKILTEPQLLSLLVVYCLHTPRFG